MLITPVIVAKRKNCRGKSVPNLDSEPEETVSEENLNKSMVKNSVSLHSNDFTVLYRQIFLIHVIVGIINHMNPYNARHQDRKHWNPIYQGEDFPRVSLTHSKRDHS